MRFFRSSSEGGCTAADPKGIAARQRIRTEASDGIQGQRRSVGADYAGVVTCVALIIAGFVVFSPRNEDRILSTLPHHVTGDPEVSTRKVTFASNVTGGKSHQSVCPGARRACLQCLMGMKGMKMMKTRKKFTMYPISTSIMCEWTFIFIYTKKCVH